MTGKADTGRRNALDPAVADILSQFKKRDQLAGLSPADRKRARRNLARNRITIDVPAKLEAAIQQAAQREGVSASALITFLTRQALAQLQRGELDLEPFKRPSRSMRFEFILQVDDGE